jgi:hypothetical protein
MTYKRIVVVFTIERAECFFSLFLGYFLYKGVVPLDRT